VGHQRTRLAGKKLYLISMIDDATSDAGNKNPGSHRGFAPITAEPRRRFGFGHPLERAPLRTRSP
jgi:hypothetical protein